MDTNNQKQSQIQIELTDEVAQGVYSNLAVIAHSASEFIIDFVNVMPGAPNAKVRSRIILTPDNAKRLLFALQENIEKFDAMMKNDGAFKQSFKDIIPPIGGIAGEA
ncbi:MAG: DUF3467 domain-containing protein [Tannerella sp.]|jgi:hypothetical protein|nr:DUF3467 domain-containing protein [Tannerella sp.]